MHPLLRALLFGAACASFGFGLALAALPAERRAGSPPPAALARSVSPPLVAPTPPEPAASPQSTPPTPSTETSPPASSAARGLAAPAHSPAGSPEPLPVAGAVTPHGRSLLSGFRLLGPGQSGGVRLARVAPGSLPAADR